MSESELAWAWVHREALRHQDFHFTPEQRQQLIDEFKGALNNDMQSHFLEALEGSVSYFLTWSAFTSSLAVDGDLKKLRLLAKQLKGLQQTFRSLDWGTRRVLAPFLVGQETPSLPLLHYRKPAEMSALDERFIASDATLVDLETLINGYLAHLKARGRRGRPKLGLHELLAIEVADNVHDIAPGAIAIATTRGGMFENIVAACLQAAGVDITEVHDIVLRAVPAYRQDARARGRRSLPF